MTNQQRTDDMESKIFQAIGEASMCWGNIGDAGMFDDVRAAQVGRALLEDVRACCVGAGVGVEATK